MNDWQSTEKRESGRESCIISRWRLRLGSASCWILFISASHAPIPGPPDVPFAGTSFRKQGKNHHEESLLQSEIPRWVNKIPSMIDRDI